MSATHPTRIAAHIKHLQSVPTNNVNGFCIDIRVTESVPISLEEALKGINAGVVFYRDMWRVQLVDEELKKSAASIHGLGFESTTQHGEHDTPWN